MSLPYVGGLAALGAAAAASSQGLVPTRMPSISDIPTDWTAVIDAFAKARDVLPATLTGVLGGAGVKEISDTNTTTTTTNHHHNPLTSTRSHHPPPDTNIRHQQHNP